MKKVILKGLNKRGKNRVSSHGPEFFITSEEQRFRENFILFESVRKSVYVWCRVYAVQIILKNVDTTPAIYQ